MSSISHQDEARAGETLFPPSGVVLSVNVGQPREIPWRGTVVRTAFFKSPIRGPVAIRDTGLEGDAQADREVHGGRDKCLFAYADEHYPAWREWLGEGPLEPGTFGENLTLTGLTEDAVALGDHFRIGTAELVVTEPRQPCYKVDVRLNREGATAEMVRSGRIGFYFGLVRAGTVGAGDRVTYLGGPAEDRISPLLLHRLSSAARPEDLDLLERVAESPYVLPDWAEMLTGKAAALRRRAQRARRPGPAWVGIRDFTVVRRTVEAPDVVSVHLTAVGGTGLPRFEGGQFVTLELPGHVPGDPALARSYSLSGPPGDEPWRITVRRPPDSQGGSRRVHLLAPGDTVGVRAPAGDFTLGEHPAGAPVVLVSGGIGITPILSMARDWAARPSGRLIAVHALRTAEDAALVAELSSALAPHPEASLDLFVEDGTHPPGLPKATVHVGRLSAARLTDLLAGRTDQAHAYLCGPLGLVKAMTELLPRLGVAEDAIHTEVFATPAPAGGEVTVPPGGWEVTFAERSVTVLWSDPAETLLDLAEETGIGIPASCRQGVCGTCTTVLRSGDVTYLRQPSIPVPEGSCLPCVAVPASRVALDA
ncbi:MOSC domain-containing protein [Streptomyces sp. NPDC059373]